MVAQVYNQNHPTQRAQPLSGLFFLDHGIKQGLSEYDGFQEPWRACLGVERAN